MGVVNTTYTFAGTDTITSSKLNNIIDDTTFTNDAISGSTLQIVSPGKLAIAASGITSNELANNSVTTNAIVDANVTTSKIADSNVTTAKIADANVTTAKIADGNVTQAKLAANVVGNGVAFRAYQSSSQSFGTNSPTKINLQTEDFDTNSNFSSSRFTATVAGYYSISGAVEMSSFADRIIAIIYKNGSAYSRGSQSGAGGYVSQVSDIVYLNGSTDYIELYGLHFESASRTTVPASASTHLAGCLIRSA